jgi:hypothetical protein
MTEVEAQARIYILLCHQQWKPKPINFSHTRKSQDMKRAPILQTGTGMKIMRNENHKPFMAKFPDNCKWYNRFKLDSKGGLVWYKDVSKTNKHTGAGTYRWG